MTAAKPYIVNRLPRYKLHATPSQLHRVVIVLCASFAAIASVAHAAVESQKRAPEIESALTQAAFKSTSAANSYRFRAWIRSKVVCDEDLARYGLALDEDWQRADESKPVVVLLHGFNSCAKNNDAIMLSIRKAGFPCASYSYPNDHTLIASAQRLSHDLRQFAECYPRRRLVLLCHSMGGMVARACLEDPFYDPGNVDRLIMIAPPTHGTLLAHFAIGTDLWEHWLAREEGRPWTRVRDSIVDGLGEAADDLCPHSPFLTELNARQRNPRVRYTILLGTGAHISEPQMEWIRGSVCEQLAKLPGATQISSRLDAMLADVDELVEGKGDGIVAVKRGRLEGVSDTIVLPFGHLAVTGKGTSAPVVDVQKVILSRIQ